MNIFKVDNIFIAAKILVFFVLFSYLMMSAFYNLGEVDYFFHLKSGEQIIKNRFIPNNDIFSFTAQSKPWLNHEWLYQVIIAVIYDLAGTEALFFIKIAVFSLSFLILAIFLLKTDWVFCFPLIFFSLQLTLRRFTLRPDNISFFFLILFLAPIVFKNRKLLFSLPLVQVFWVNIHGFFFLGPLILFLYLVFSLIGKKDFDREFYRNVRFVFLLSILACFLTPYPLETLSYPFKIVKDIFSGSQSVFYDYVQELQSPLSDFPQRASYIGLLVFTFLCLGFARDLNFFYPALFVVMAAFSVNSLRNVYFLVPAAAAIFADRYQSIKDFFLQKIVQKQGYALLRYCFLFFSLGLCLNMFEEIKTASKGGRSYFGDDENIEYRSDFLSEDLDSHPHALIDFMKKEELPPRMFNTFNLGAPLIFNFYPQRLVFIDGRTEVYGADFFSSYIKASQGNVKQLEELVEKYKLQGFIISYLRDYPPKLIKVLVDKGYVCVYFSGEGIIFIENSSLQNYPELASKALDFSKVSPKSPNLLETLKNSQPSIKRPFNVGYVLYLLGEYSQSKKYLDQVISIEPNHALSYLLIADIFYREKDYELAYQYCRNALFFKPKLARANKLLAKIYIKTAKFDAAREITQRYKVDFDELFEEVNNE
ncbi:MAG: hypothetical protein JW867_03375 [Candidatus Omnitrophica bacterium]|nr:hypothetical protein [Candidatus Omnitrophota bacterium]